MSTMEPMTPMEKVAWLELLVCGIAFAIVLALYPWLGNSATGAFGLFGFLACGAWFLRKRGTRVVIDERDREIERQATRRGIETAWMFLFLSLIAFSMWSNIKGDGNLDATVINWLIWLQFAICYGVKGSVAVWKYRKQRHAT